MPHVGACGTECCEHRPASLGAARVLAAVGAHEQHRPLDLCAEPAGVRLVREALEVEFVQRVRAVSDRELFGSAV